MTDTSSEPIFWNCGDLIDHESRKSIETVSFVRRNGDAKQRRLSGISCHDANRLNLLRPPKVHGSSWRDWFAASDAVERSLGGRRSAMISPPSLPTLSLGRRSCRKITYQGMAVDRAGAFASLGPKKDRPMSKSSTTIRAVATPNRVTAHPGDARTPSNNAAKATVGKLMARLVFDSGCEEP